MPRADSPPKKPLPPKKQGLGVYSIQSPSSPAARCPNVFLKRSGSWVKRKTGWRFGQFFVLRRQQAREGEWLPYRRPSPYRQVHRQENPTIDKDKKTYVLVQRVHGMGKFVFLPPLLLFFEGCYLKKNIKTPAVNCKRAKSRFTVFTGNFPRSCAPKSPPAVTPNEVGMSTEKSYNPFHA